MDLFERMSSDPLRVLRPADTIKFIYIHAKSMAIVPVHNDILYQCKPFLFYSSFSFIRTACPRRIWIKIYKILAKRFLYYLQGKKVYKKKMTILTGR